MKYYLSLFILSLAFTMTTHADEDHSHEQVTTFLRILEEQPESIEAWIGDRVYLKPDKVHLTRRAVLLQDGISLIPLPAFAYDQNGLFMLCSREAAQKEAKDHADRAVGALIDAVGHSAAAGTLIDFCPPVAVYEGYKAVESWKEAAREYNAYCEARDRAE
jgi:hypothetical protein